MKRLLTVGGLMLALGFNAWAQVAMHKDVQMGPVKDQAGKVIGARFRMVVHPEGYAIFRLIAGGNRPQRGKSAGIRRPA